MALVAVQTDVLALEHVAGFLVIESFDVPLDQRKVESVVIGVAAGALLTGTRRDVVRGVQTPVRRQPHRNLGVTLHTLQFGLATELVALGAICGTVEELVRAREGAGGNLRRCGGPQPKQADQQRGHEEEKPKRARADICDGLYTHAHPAKSRHQFSLTLQPYLREGLACPCRIL